MKSKPDWKGKNILIVEDDNTSYIYARETLKAFNPVISRCKSGLTAFFQCMSYPSPDLVIMDIKLPELSGYDSTRLIKKFQPHIPIIALTACAMSNERQQGLKAGCDYYLTKPILPDDLIDIVNIYLKRSIMKQSHPITTYLSQNH